MMSQENPRQGAAGERDELVAGIQETRQDLAQTVQALAAKADVPARVRGKATQVRDQLSGTFSTARDKAPQVRDQVGASLAKASQSIPEPARRTTRQATDAAAKRPAVLYAVAGACTAAGLWLWRRGRS